jgi:tripartite-type tricarboxylate transporter receptor subunit TctC
MIHNRMESDMSEGFCSFRRRFIAGSAALVAFAMASMTPVSAQDYPGGPVQILVAYGPGGGTDTLARLIAPSLSKVLNKPVTVQNLPGGGGQVAAAAMLRDGADGLVILATNEPDLFMSTVFSKPPYQANDLQIIMVDVQDPRVFLVRKDSPINTFADFVARAKAEPNKLAVSVAQGSAQELFAKWLFGKLGIQVRVVGYDGGGPAANAMIAGDVVANIGDDFARMNVRPQSKALFVGSQRKSPRWPEAQALTDALKPFNVMPPSPEFLSRYGVYAVSAAFKAKNPAGYAKLQKAMVEARDGAEFKAYFEKNALQDLSIGRPGEAMQTTMSLDFQEIPKLK